MDQSAKIFVAGHKGMVGSAILRHLHDAGFTNIVTRTSRDLDLCDQNLVNSFFEAEKPAYVFLAAGRVGGINANNSYRAEFIYQNLAIQINVIHAAYLNNVTKLISLGSSCIYPKMADQPLKEEYLLTGALEKTNEPYAVAKIAGLKMCDAYRSQYGCNFISTMPTNLYGPNDNYDLNNSHVLPALLKKIHRAMVENHENIEIWGTGTPKREFLHVDDLANACFFLMENYDDSGFVNIGTGMDISIKDLALMIKDIVGFQGELKFNTEKPDGTPQKLLEVTKLHNMGWTHSIGLREGIETVYNEIEGELQHSI